MHFDMFSERFVTCLWARTSFEALMRNDVFNSSHKTHLWNV